MAEDNNIGRVVFAFIFLIIVFFIVGFIVWRFIIVHPMGVQGSLCRIDDDCSAGHYCGGGNVCASGVSGGTNGAVCTANSDCQVGFQCKSDGHTMRCLR